ncbi:F-actin-monooxygenase MICAL2 isoform X2 [Denticeps clupeoides]|uniref:F-actin-monooxygenase MICAL2 isoform X2 n=1 Tax=Denticeps clupeoides TaxID=299321 RepID=UPI0010A314B0|nr:F-actin-monooxygenase MICAL2-like isoform X2 [Denticeps clupeoides]
MGEVEEEQNQAGKLFENFVQATTCKGTLQAFSILCRQLDLDPLDYETFYSSLKTRVTYWKAKALWSKLDKRASHKEYKKSTACTSTKCLIIGGGPCGLRTAIELALLGAKVVVIEKRDTFSRNNVLHLWSYTIHDLRGLGAKKFYGKFCAGSIDHISIRQLQLMLLKIALLLGVEFHISVEFVKLLEPAEDQENEGPGWRAEVCPADHPVAEFDFDVVVGADGRRNTLEGFRRKEFRGKLAIAITANFVNRNTTAEAKVEEISGVAFIFNQKFFQDLRQETGIDLENIVYYKDNTHYFVMTAKKQSLLDKGVIIHDYTDTEMLLSTENVNQEALFAYAREAADYATHYQLPTLDFAMNHLGQPDAAMFDFTSMYASENAALVRERFSHQLLVALVGDSLLEPFWPMGTGCARGFLAAFDTAWMVKSWAQGRAPLDVLAERESLYRLLPQTTPENIAKNFEQYTIDPVTRYPNLNSSCVRPHQVRHLYVSGEMKACSLERAVTIRRPVNLCRKGSEVRPSLLQTWCQKQTDGYQGVSVSDLTSSWTSGLTFCALIHRFRPQLIDYDLLKEEDHAQNLQLAFDIAEQNFGIKPFTTGKELAACLEPDKQAMVTYISKFYELFRGTPLAASSRDSRREANSEVQSSKPTRPVHKSLSFTQPRKRIPKDVKKLEDNDPTNKRRRKIGTYLEEATNLSNQASLLGREGREPKENKVKSMATQLLAKFEQSTLRKQPEPSSIRVQQTPSPEMTAPPLPSNRQQFQAAFQVQPPEDHTVSPHTSPLLGPKWPCMKSKPLPCHVHTQSQPAVNNSAAAADHAQCPSSCQSAVLAMKGMLQRLQKVEDKIIERKAQTQNAREFHKKSIKEKAVHLSGLFSASPGVTTSQPDSCTPVPTNSTSELTCPPHYLPECSAYSSSPSYTSSFFCLLPQQAAEYRELNRNLSKSGREVSTVLSLSCGSNSLFTPQKPNPCQRPVTGSKQGTWHRDCTQGLGGSDTCHVCKRRVYVVERINTEGLYFHRECFRCSTCNVLLRQGCQAFSSEQGKLYCKQHFAQQKTVVTQERMSTVRTGKLNSGLSDGSSLQTPRHQGSCDTTRTTGTLPSLLRKSLSWPVHATQSVLAMPQRLSCWMRGALRAAGLHLRDNAEDYTFLYELLSLGVPLLYSMQEVLLQMHVEVGPVSLQDLLQWAEHQLGLRLI